MKNLFRLIRPHQWIKNLFVFLPLFFGGVVFQPSLFLNGLLAFMAFSFVASSVYCFNDIADAEADRRHPVKCKRPIASGAVSIGKAYVLMVLMATIGALCIVALPQEEMKRVGIIIATYYVMNLAYCGRLKDFAILDVCIIAFGFVLRILAGAVAGGVQPSQWILLMTFLLTLFLSFAKRRDDVLRMNATGEAPRKNTSHYNLEFINTAITITGSITLVCYIMYTVSPEVVKNFHTNYLYLTSIFVLIGLLRYIQITVVEQKSGDPTKIMLRDRFIQLIVVAWFAAFLIIIYI